MLKMLNPPNIKNILITNLKKEYFNVYKYILMHTELRLSL